MDQRDAVTHPRTAYLHALLFLTVLVVAAYLRFTGLNWDQAQWIHPDEGHMRAITAAIRLPDRAADYFDTHRSPLNPRNRDQVYSYGTLPLFATRALVEWLDRGCGLAPAPLNAWVARRLIDLPSGMCARETFTFTYSAFVGRHLSALADLGTVVLVYVIARRLHGPVTGLLAMALSAVTALMIQQAHFYTVDSAAAFFTLLTAYLSIRAVQAPPGGSVPWGSLALAGLSTGLATAGKVSAAVAAGFVALAGVGQLWRRIEYRQREVGGTILHHGWQPFLRLVPSLAVAALLSLIAFRLAQPYAFEGPGLFGVRPSPEWFGRLSQIRLEQSGALDYPSGRQWANRLPVLFPWLNMVVWGMGLPLGLAAWAGWAFVGWELLHSRPRRAASRWGWAVVWIWSTLYFGFYATRWVKAMRYFLPLYPLLITMAAYALMRLSTAAVRWRRRIGMALTAVVVVGAALWGGALFGIYRQPHTRIAGSRWTYDHVPAGSTIANEHWDWGLPLRVDGHDPFHDMYTGIKMENYNEDTPTKRAQLVAWLDTADYVVLASNRLYASIPRLPERYPLTIAYYRALFAGELGFELAADVTSYPRIGPLVFPDQENPFPLTAAAYAPQGDLTPVPLPAAEESFSVYDHPRVLIFRKTPDYSRERVEQALGAVDLSDVRLGLTPQEATPRWVHLLHAPFVWLAISAAILGVVVLYRTELPRRHRPSELPSVATER